MIITHLYVALVLEQLNEFIEDQLTHMITDGMLPVGTMRMIDIVDAERNNSIVDVLNCIEVKKYLAHGYRQDSRLFEMEFCLQHHPVKPVAGI